MALIRTSVPERTETRSSAGALMSAMTILTPFSARALTPGFSADEGRTSAEISYIDCKIPLVKRRILTNFPRSRRPLRIEVPVSPVAPRRRTFCLLILKGCEESEV
jgi:hypothetical protein